MLGRKRFFGFAVAAAALLASGASHAQTTTGPVIGPSGQPYPDRIVNGNDLGISKRQQNQNPFGINYDDCLQDMILRFTVSISGLNGQTLQYWATNSGDCLAPASRGVGGTAPTCWKLDEVAGMIIVSPRTFSFDVHVRDIVGPQAAPPFPAGVAATRMRGQQLGEAACRTQPTFSAVPMYIWVLAVDGSGTVAGMAYEYGNTGTFITDLIGPPAPSISAPEDGDTLMVVHWTPNLDSDTAGYDVFFDPIPGLEDNTDAAANAPPGATVSYCPDASPVVVEAATGDGSDDGSTSDAADESTPAPVSSCVPINAVSPPALGAGTCYDPILAGSLVQDSGVVSTTVFDDAGNVVEAGTASGPGGLSTIPPNYVVHPGPSGVTVSDKNTSSYTVTGLRNMVTYAVVVAAVDGSGNVGPPSSPKCDFPAPVNDFWNQYRGAGGRAGGGFCALEEVGRPMPAAGGAALLLATSVLALRRSKRRRG